MRLRLFTVCIVLLVAVVSGITKDSPEIKGKLFPDYNTPENQALNEKIAFARKLISGRNYEGAAAYLESLYEVHNQHTIIMNLLRQCYSRLQQYGKLELLLQRQIELNPQDIGAKMVLADAIARQGKKADAEKMYLEIASSLNNNRHNLIRSIISSMLSHDMDSAAVQLIGQERKKSTDSTLLAIEMGKYYEKNKLYREASYEYYLLLKDTTTLGSEAERRLLALLAFEDSEPVTESFLIQKDAEADNGRILDVLSTHYLRTEQFERAYAFIVAHDSTDGFTGVKPMSYLSHCYNRQLYAEAIRMGDYIFDHYQDKPGILISSSFHYGMALIEAGQFTRAEEVYHNLFEMSRSPRDKGTALYYLGSIYMDAYKKYDTALLYFDSVVTHYRTGYSYQQALMATPICLFRQGKLNEAYNEYDALMNLRLNEELKEESLYRQAMIRLYQKQVDTASVLLNKLMVDYPTGLYFNDAIRMILTIQEAQQYPHILNDYVRALYFEERKMADSMKAQFQLVADNTVGVLADLALYQLAQIAYAEHNWDQAVQYVHAISEKYPESYYLPFALKTEADIYNEDTATREKADELYKELLEKYPNYPFTEEIRKKLREGEANQAESA